MKTTAVIGAMEEEIAVLKRRMEIKSACKIIGTTFYTGTLAEREIVLARSGVGKVGAAICAQVMIDRFGADRVINTGCAGGVYSGLELGDVVISSELVQHDMDLTHTGNYAAGHISGFPGVFLKADEELVKIALEACIAVLPGCGVYVNRIATGDRLIADAATKNWIWENFGAYCVEMEGAAIAQTCILNGVPFVVIRSVSDKADKNETPSFRDFVVRASDNSCRVVEQMLGML